MAGTAIRRNFSGNLSRRFWPGVVRIIVALFSVCSVAWAFFSVSNYRAETEIADVARQILSGEIFSSEQLDALLRRSATNQKPFRSLALTDLAVVRLRLLEVSGSKPGSLEFDRAKSAVADAVAGVPTNSFLWLSEYWLQSREADVPDVLRLLGMSYWSGPNEAWIAIRRNRLVLGSVLVLPHDLSDQVLTEFSRLVKSGLYSAAAEGLASAGLQVQERLLNGLTFANDSERSGFVKALEAQNLDPSLLKGYVKPDRPF